MTNVLAHIELSPSGEPRSGAASLIAGAARLGTPIAVVATLPGQHADLEAQLGELGASHIYIAESDAVGAVLIGPELEALSAAAAALQPTAILIPKSIDGREIAARLAVRLGGGLLSDALDVRADGARVIASHSVFGGAYNVESSVDDGLAIVTLRQRAFEGHAPAVKATVTIAQVDVDASKFAAIDTAHELGGIITSRTQWRDQGRLRRPRPRIRGELRPDRKVGRCTGCGRGWRPGQPSTRDM